MRIKISRSTQALMPGRSLPKPFLPKLQITHRCKTACMATASMDDTDSASITSRKHVVICGAGIIGACTAYYLSHHPTPASVTVIEREQPACAASGKAGGFLALDWNDGTPLQQLARLSYRLHAELAETLGPDAVGYRPVSTLQIMASQQSQQPSGRAKPTNIHTKLPPWLDGNVLSARPAGDASTTSQVHPRLLTQALLERAVQRGTQVVTGTVQGLKRGEDGRVQGVMVDGGQEVEADAVVIAMGPWTAQAQAWLPNADLGDITGLKYHSIVVQPPQPVGAVCLESRVIGPAGEQQEVEVYPRPDGTVYICGQPQQVPVPPTAAQVTVEPVLARAVQSAAAAICSSLGEGQSRLDTQQACYLPITRHGLPLVGQVPGEPGVYVAAGHSCWGILNGPATGKVLAELIIDGRVHCLSDGAAAFAPRHPMRA